MMIYVSWIFSEDKLIKIKKKAKSKENIEEEKIQVARKMSSLRSFSSKNVNILLFWQDNIAMHFADLLSS